MQEVAADRVGRGWAGVEGRTDLAPEEASCTQVEDHINDLVEGGADAHVLLCIQPTGLVGITLRRLHHITTCLCCRGRGTGAMCRAAHGWGPALEQQLGPLCQVCFVSEFMFAVNTSSAAFIFTASIFRCRTTANMAVNWCTCIAGKTIWLHVPLA